MVLGQTRKRLEILRQFFLRSPGWCELSAVLILGGSFLGLRLFQLTAIPIYLDESLYLYWAKLFASNSALAYVPLQDGKTPLFMWIVSVIFSWVKNPLFAGRMLSVFAGLGTLLSSWLLVRLLLGRKIALVFLIFFTFLPYGLLIERLAFVDSLLMFWASLSFLFLFISFLLKGQLWFALPVSFFFSFLAGFTLGLGFYTKTSARAFFFAFLIASLIWLLLRMRSVKKFLQIALNAGVFAFVYWQMLDLLRVGASRFWPMIAVKEHQLTFSFQELLHNPLNKIYFIHGRLLWEYVAHYFTLPLFLLALVGGIAVLGKKYRNGLPLLIITVFLTSAIFFSAKVFASRYIYLIAPGVTILAALGFIVISQRWPARFTVSLFLMVVILLLFVDLKILVDPKHAWFSSDDLSFLLCSEISGYGLVETASFIQPLLSKQPLTLGIDSKWGPPEAILLYLDECEGCSSLLLRRYLNVGSIPNELYQDSKNHPTFLLLLSDKSQPLELLKLDNVELVFKIPRAPCSNGRTSFAYLLEILPQ